MRNFFRRIFSVVWMLLFFAFSLLVCASFWFTESHTERHRKTSVLLMKTQTDTQRRAIESRWGAKIKWFFFGFFSSSVGLLPFFTEKDLEMIAAYMLCNFLNFSPSLSPTSYALTSFFIILSLSPFAFFCCSPLTGFDLLRLVSDRRNSLKHINSLNYVRKEWFTEKQKPKMEWKLRYHIALKLF